MIRFLSENFRVLVDYQVQVSCTITAGQFEGSSTGGSLNTVDQPFLLVAICTQYGYGRDVTTGGVVTPFVRTNFSLPVTEMTKTNHGFTVNTTGYWSHVHAYAPEHWLFFNQVSINAGSSYTVTTTAGIMAAVANNNQAVVTYTWYFIPDVGTLGLRRKR